MNARKGALLIGFGVSLLFTIFMLSRALGGVQKLRHPPGDIEPWMTLAHVARTFSIPPNDLANLVQIPADQRGTIRRITVAEVAAKRGQTFEQFRTDLRRLIADYQYTHADQPLSSPTPRGP